MMIVVVSCNKNEPVDHSGTLNGHDYVDLGLPSGTLWATCNVGAETLEGYGVYFAWGETAPKEIYDWSTYKYWQLNLSACGRCQRVLQWPRSQVFASW